MQMVRSAVLDLVTNVVVANPAFAHTCLQLLVFSLLPPPGTPTPDTSRGSWKMAEDEVMVQQAVLAALMKVCVCLCVCGPSMQENSEVSRT